MGVASLADEMVIKPDAPGGMPDYRLCLVLSFFYKFYLTVTSKLEDIPSNELTATEVGKHVHGCRKLLVHVLFFVETFVCMLYKSLMLLYARYYNRIRNFTHLGLAFHTWYFQNSFMTYLSNF